MRQKYRPVAVQPEGTVVKYNASHSLAKKVRPKTPPPKPPIVLAPYKPPPMDPSLTQKRIVALTVASEEEILRKQESPNIFERVEIYERWLKKKERDSKIARKREAARKHWEAKVTAALDMLENKHNSTINWTDSNNDSNIKKSMKERKMTKISSDIESSKESKQSMISLDDEDDDLLEDDDVIKNAKKRVEKIKERTILKTRDNARFHEKIFPIFRNLKALSCSLGIGKLDAPLTYIFPWLMIGRGSATKSYRYLLDMGITHILNATEEIGNFFPEHFVYLQCPVRDNEKADIGQYFNAAADFIRTAEQGKGRVFVFCVSGVSRAPTMIIAYLVKYREVCLIDAFDFLSSLRPVALPNRHFLFQLAEWEISLGKGSSVLLRKEWRFYEFNVIRGRQYVRKHRGLYATVIQLYKQHNQNSTLKAVLVNID